MAGAHADEDLPAPLQEAAAWRVALTDQGLETSRAFEAWLAADARHPPAWREVTALWRSLDAAGADPSGERLQRRAHQRLALAAARRISPSRLAALAAVVLLAAALAIAMSSLGVLRPGETIWTTREARRVVRLADGSRLTLDASTRVRVRLGRGQRDIELLQGQARFDVAHDAQRPFRVKAQGKTVTALGTSFTVDRGGGRVTITLLEGRVEVSDDRPAWRLGRGPGGLSPAVLRPGQRLSVEGVRPTDGQPIEQVSLDQATAWEAGKLVFANEPLGAAVERVSRYSAQKISAGPGTEGVRLSGVFDAGDSATFIEAVTHYYPLDAVVMPGGGVVLRGGSEINP